MPPPELSLPVDKQVLSNGVSLISCRLLRSHWWKMLPVALVLGLSCNTSMCSVNVKESFALEGCKGNPSFF